MRAAGLRRRVTSETQTATARGLTPLVAVRCCSPVRQPPLGEWPLAAAKGEARGHDSGRLMITTAGPGNLFRSDRTTRHHVPKRGRRADRLLIRTATARGLTPLVAVRCCSPVRQPPLGEWPLAAAKGEARGQDSGRLMITTAGPGNLFRSDRTTRHHVPTCGRRADRRSTRTATARGLTPLVAVRCCSPVRQPPLGEWPLAAAKGEARGHDSDRLRVPTGRSCKVFRSSRLVANCRQDHSARVAGRVTIVGRLTIGGRLMAERLPECLPHG